MGYFMPQWVICFLWDANAKEAVSNDSVNFYLALDFKIEALWTPGEAAWRNGQRVGLAIRRSRVHVPLWALKARRCLS